MYIDKLDDIVNEYNNTYHRTIRMKPIDVGKEVNLILVKKLMIKILNFKLAIMLEYQNTKTFLLKDWSEEVFVMSKIKNTVPWTYVINDFNGKEIVGMFY